MATTQPAKGFNGGYIKIGEETTWGTEVARTNQIEVESVDLSLSSEPKFVEVISKAYTTDDEIYQGQVDVQGSFTYPMRYEGSEVLIKELLGADTVTEEESFVVDATNNKFDFNIGESELTATVASSTYIMGLTQATVASLCKAIYDAIVAAEEAGTYTVAFSASTKKITITRSTGTFSILWKSGTNGADGNDVSIASLIGFADAADDTGEVTYTADTAVVPIYDHAFKFSDTVTEGLSIEKEIDTNLTTGKSLLYTGCKIDSMAFNIESDGVLKTTATLICENEELEETPTTGLSTSTSPLVLYHQGVVTIDTDISAKVVNFSCEIKRNLSSDRYRFSRYIKQPVVTRKAEVTGTMTVEFDANTYYSLFINQTVKVLNVKFTGAAIKPGIYYEIEFIFNYKYLKAAAVNPSDQGIVMVDIPFVAIASDSTNREVEINIQNTVTTI